MEVLASYTSALLLLGIAALMLYESVERVLNPVAIHYNEAITVAIIGLGVNLVCAKLLHGGHDHDHDHGHGHDAHGAQHHDLNLHAAYIHVLTDAATSVLAIVALFAGKSRPGECPARPEVVLARAPAKLVIRVPGRMAIPDDSVG